MCDIKKAHPTVGAAGRAEGQETGRLASPVYEFTTGRRQTQGRVESVLLEGEENALSATEVISVLGLNNTRELRLLVAAERSDGALILTSDKGYFIPQSGEAGRAELRAFVARMESAAWNTHKATAPARKVLAVLEGQFSLLDFITERGC